MGNGQYSTPASVDIASTTVPCFGAIVIYIAECLCTNSVAEYVCIFLYYNTVTAYCLCAMHMYMCTLSYA